MVIGLASIRADLDYQQGLHKMFTRSTKYDYYWPALAHLGEQAIYNREIYCQGSNGAGWVDQDDQGDDGDVFGYQERWAEYRYRGNVTSNQMRSTATTPLDVWHLGQEFSSLPALDEDFIVEDPPIDRVVADTADPAMVLDLYFSYKHVRPMPVFSVPGLIDHF